MKKHTHTYIHIYIHTHTHVYSTYVYIRMLHRITYFSLLTLMRSFTSTPSTILYGNVMVRLKCEPSLCRNWDMGSIMKKWVQFSTATNVSLSAIPSWRILGPNQPPISGVLWVFFPGGGRLHSRGVQFNTKLHILPKVKKARNSTYTYTSFLVCLTITGLLYPQVIF